jgi:hypothetical protein
MYYHELNKQTTTHRTATPPTKRLIAVEPMERRPKKAESGRTPNQTKKRRKPHDKF